MYRFLCIGLIATWLALNGGIAFGQTRPPDLTVTLHDVVGTPLPGVIVIVRDASGSQALAQAATDANGSVSFTHLMESQVRVTVVGTLPNGTKLYQPGNDAAGISLLLGTLPYTLALRSAADGMIVPDPAAIAREPGVPVAANVAVIPTAPVASTDTVGQAPSPPVTAAPAIAVGASATTADPDVSAIGSSGQFWLGLAVLILLIGAGIGILVVQRRLA